MNPQLLQYLQRIKGSTEQLPGAKISDLREYMKLTYDRDRAQTGASEAQEKIKGYGQDIQATSGEIQTELSDVQAYKRPQREGVSKGSMNFGLLLGGLGALAGVDNPANLTKTAIGGQKELKDQEYDDSLDTLRERMAVDRQTKMDKVAGLQAKLSGTTAQLGSAMDQRDFEAGRARDIGSELFQKGQAAQAQSNWGAEFGFTREQAAKADARWAKEFGMRLAEHEWAMTTPWRKSAIMRDQMVADGVDKETADFRAFAPFILDEANARYQPDILKNQFHLSGKQLEEADENLTRIRELNKWLPKQLAQEFAANELSMQNTRQTMAARSIDMANAKKAGDTVTLTALQQAQYGDYEKGITQAVALAKKARETIITLVPTEVGYKAAKAGLERQAEQYEERAFTLKKERDKILGG
jgi:hypothetical protein